MSASLFRAEQAAWLSGRLSTQPWHLSGALRRRHASIALGADGPASVFASGPAVADANRDLLDHLDRYSGELPADASDEHVRAYAERHARQCREVMRFENGDEFESYAAGYQYVRSQGIEPPRPSESRKIDAAGCVLRMQCALWWRRQTRTTFGRRIESAARAVGEISKRRGLYVSRDGFERWRERTNRNAQTMADTYAINDEGDEICLADIVTTGAARRSELMARIRGIEDVSKRRGHVALFVTWTVPTEFHAVHSMSGDMIEAGRHVTPRDGQRWLSRQWAKARAKLKREEREVYGLRVAEPHHDGTPHWHLLVFVSEEQAEAVGEIFRTYAIAGDKRKKRVRRACTIERIDPDRGSATGYVAKYISKSVDGAALDGAMTRDADGGQVMLDLDPGEVAHRVRAWSSQWGIRQFQFIGSPPVTVWRELRRMAAPSDDGVSAAKHRMKCEERPAWTQIELLRHAADAGDWAGYVELMGGPCVPRDQMPARMDKLQDAGHGRYGEAQYRPLVRAYGEIVWTRAQRWRIEYRPGGEPGQGEAEGDQYGRRMIAEPAGWRNARGKVVRHPLDVSHRQSITPEWRDEIAARDPSCPSSEREAIAPWTRGNNCTQAGYSHAGTPNGVPVNQSKNQGGPPCRNH